MALLSQTLLSFRENPVALAELRHQRRSATAHYKWQRFPGLFGVGLLVALLSFLALRAAPQLAALLQLPVRELDTLLRGWFDTTTILIGALITIHHLSFATAALQLAASSIAREKQGRTWESLLLTGVNARQIVYGKWGATMRILWEAYRSLLLLRFSVALWMIVVSTVSTRSPALSTPSLVHALLIGIVTAVFPLCYAAFTVTLGLLASLLVTRETSAHRLASLFHVCTIILSLCLIVFSFSVPFYDIDPGLVSIIPALFVTPLDGGMLALIGMVATNGSISLHYLFGLLLCITLYAALTWSALRGAQVLAIRQRALPPQSSIL